MAFGADYAAAYDALYQDKDYAAECDLIERAFELYGQGQVRRVLDLGCGTGGHAVPLSERGYTVVGIDRSLNMLQLARERGSTCRFELGDVTSIDLHETFDAVLMMFAVLGYQTSNTEAQAALATARRHLTPGGLFLADVWYGPAVLAQRPSDRARVIDLPNAESVIRLASAELDSRAQACSVAYHLWRIGDGRVLSETRERHRMRYFFPLELELLLAGAGLELVRLGAFPQLEVEPNDSTWNVTIVARAA
jgi:SAM-dependent methyltransferase